MAETRTPKQIAADRLDLEMHRLAAKAYEFGIRFDDRSLTEAGHQISSLRTPRPRPHAPQGT